MKRVMNWVLAAILTICGSSVFVACSNDDNPVAPQNKPLPKVSKVYSSSMVKAESNVAEPPPEERASGRLSMKKLTNVHCFMIFNGRVTVWKAYRPLKDHGC